MLLPGGSLGIPLTLLQLTATRLHTGSVPIIEPTLVAANFLLGSAIYGADRIDTNTTNLDKILVKSSTVGSLAYFSTDPWTLPIVPLIYILHEYYADLKKIIGPIKPFFVSVFWTIAIFYLPIAKSHNPDDFNDILTPATFFLSMSGFSHIADITDIEEDRNNEVYTPAVLMGKDEAIHFGLACILASVVIHELHPNHSVVDFVYDLASISVAVAFVNKEFRYASMYIGIISILIRLYISVNRIPRLDIILWILQSTESSHASAIDLATWLVKGTENIQQPYKKYLIESALKIIEIGDDVGHQLLLYYADLLRNMN